MELNTQPVLSLPRTLRTTRFGEVSYRPEELFDFRWGLPGFPLLRGFVVLTVGSQQPYVWLQSVERPEVAIPLVDPWAIFEDYDPHLPAVTSAVMEIERADDFCMMCVTVVGKGADDFSVNLLAPIVFNLRTRIGRQVMLEDSGYAVRTPVPRIPEGTRKEATSA